MTLVAGVDVGNATTEVVIVACGPRGVRPRGVRPRGAGEPLDTGKPPRAGELREAELLGVARLPTRGQKGSAESLRGAATLVRRLERRLGLTVDEVRVAPLRAVATTTLTIPGIAPPTGRLRVLAAGVTTPGGTGACVGTPVWLDTLPSAPANPSASSPSAGSSRPAPVVALVPASLGYARAAARLRDLLAAGVPVGAVLSEGDEGVLIANRLDRRLPVLDQVDTSAAAACGMLAVEVRPAGQPLTLLTDPVALSAALSLDDAEASDAATLARTLLDYSNVVVGLRGIAGGRPPGIWLAGDPGGRPPGAAPRDTDLSGGGGRDGPAGDPARPDEPWVTARGERMPLRMACSHVAGWPVGSVSALGTASGETQVDDLFALDLAAVADMATARRGSLGRAALVASLQRRDEDIDHAGVLSGLLGRPVRCVLTEPAAARLGALTTPGARPGAVVVDLGAGTIDVIAPDGEVVAAGAGELLTAAVAGTLGISRAAADWVKRGPCVRVEGGQRFEAEDGSRGFLDRPAAAAEGMLAVAGPAGLLPFDRRHGPAEWRAVRLRLKQAVFCANLLRAVRTLGRDLGQVLLAGGPAGDDELTGVLLRCLPDGVAAGRANVGGTLAGSPVGHRYAVALGLALAGE